MIPEGREELYEQMVSHISAVRSEVDDVSEVVLLYAIRRAEDDILNFIHQDVVPMRLESVWMDMVHDYLDDVQTQTQANAAEDFNVKSLTMGDTTISKVSPYEMIQRLREKPSTLSKYRSKLYPFRRLL